MAEGEAEGEKALQMQFSYVAVRVMVDHQFQGQGNNRYSIQSFPGRFGLAIVFVSCAYSQQLRHTSNVLFGQAWMDLIPNVFRM